ncbi:MAG: RHS repeat-associated core domain-containing protein [Verrucomicrobia bacterium]|nr:RHS repeat-associated core domain-containing protein [Verrucomicrobiota bacterium]
MQRYVWGMDVSGSVAGAGGVGGLIAVKPAGGVAHFAAHDGNGNVMGLVDGSTGTLSGNYEYGPFGEPIRVTGTLGKANPFRWSTKYTNDETDLVYYGYRYYNPSTGRFLNRDPLGEQGGPNLYAFVANDPVDSFDPLGLATYGKFIIRFVPRIKVPDEQIKSAGGNEYLAGFEVEYVPDSPQKCGCPKDRIRLVQAIKSSGGTGEGPHFDASVSQRRANISGEDTSLPPYTGYVGNHGTLSFLDAPFNPRKLFGKTVFTMEVCGVCKDGKDRVLGCVTFTFGDVKRQPVVPGATTRPNSDGFEIQANDPSKLWQDSLRQWEEMRKR